MAKKKKDIRSDEIVSNFNDRVRFFMDAFSRENPDIRDRLVRNLPAYNLLVSMGSESFEEIALRLAARERGELYDPAKPPVPVCPSCGQADTVKKRKSNLYRCGKCKEMFAANYNSISSGTKCDALTWAKLIQCLLSFYGQTKTCEYCEISPETYFSLRNRVFYAMRVLLDSVKLSGEIQVDNTFVRISYKGVDLQAHDYSEDSVFYDNVFVPRPARQRGGRNAQSERNANHICIFTGIDDWGHVLARFAGIGISNYSTLSTYVPTDKFLQEVPKTDSFKDLFKKQASEPKTKPGDKSIMIADKEGAIKKFAETMEIDFESHVYRKNNVQLKLSKDSHNIQRVNALHKRLKDFLRASGYISTKYLPGYLTMFEFVENTGGTKKAIKKLMEILATPNLGKSPTYYEELFTVPNYLQEWLEDKSALRKIPYNKLLAFYLYDHIRNKENYPDTKITMKFIEEETGYTAPSIRKIYRDLNASGYSLKILRYFGEPIDMKKDCAVEQTDVSDDELSKNSQKEKIQRAAKTFNPTVLAIYDEYAQIRRMPDGKRPPFHVFLDEKNKQYGTNFKMPNLYAKFKAIEESGIRPPLPEINRYDNTHGKSSTAHAGIVAVTRAIQVLAEYESIILSYREKGEPVPKNNYIIPILSEKYGVSYRRIEELLSIGRNHRRRQQKKDEQSL